MNEQTSLNSGFHAEPDFKVYNGWILTIGELKKKLAVYNDHDQVRLDFRGKTPFGERIDISMPIECIGRGGGGEDADGKWVNLIYLNCPLPSSFFLLLFPVSSAVLLCIFIISAIKNRSEMDD